VGPGEGDVLAETVKERGKAGASAEGDDAKAVRVGRGDVTVR